MNKSFFTIIEVSRLTGLNEEQIVRWIEKEWVTPPESSHLDTEDVARLQMIQDLIYELGANDDAVPIILHLVDQLYGAREEIRLIKSTL